MVIEIFDWGPLGTDSSALVTAVRTDDHDDRDAGERVVAGTCQNNQGKHIEWSLFGEGKK